MGYQERKEIIRQLQEVRQSRVVVHINSDRRAMPGMPMLAGFNTKLATEAQPLFYEVVRELGKQQRLDLFLYTSGGQTDSVWPLVSLFREFGQELNVLVHHKAHSAGTLICLGADKLLLGEASELSPVDPSTGNQFNPVDDVDKLTRRAISVEEVTSYFDLAKDPAKDGKDSATDGNEGKSKIDLNLAFRILAENVHPLALGNVNRSYKQIRELAKRLLNLHYQCSAGDREKRIQDIVDILTQKRYSHTDILNREEVKDLLGEEMVKFATEEEQRLMWDLFEDYSNSLSLRTTFSLYQEMGDEMQKKIELIGAFIESDSSSFIYRSLVYLNQRSVFPPGVQVNIPPGQQIPLITGYPREVNAQVIEAGWVSNEKTSK